MPILLQQKRSSTPGAVPTPAQLAPGELAVNTADLRLYARDAGGTVRHLAGLGAPAYNAANLPGLRADQAGAQAWCPDAWTADGQGCMVFWNGTAWRTPERLAPTATRKAWFLAACRTRLATVFDAPRWLAQFVDFGNASSGLPDGMSSWQTGGAWSSAAVTDNGARGVAQLATGAAATNRAGLSQGANLILHGAGRLAYKAVRYRVSALSNATDTYTLRLGFGDQINSASENVDGAFGRYTHGANGGNVQAVNRANNAESTADLAVAPPTSGWQILEVLVDGLTGVDYIVNLGAAVSVTGNIPNGSGREFGFTDGIFKSVGTASVNLLLDWVALVVENPDPR